MTSKRTFTLALTAAIGGLVGPGTAPADAAPLFMTYQGQLYDNGVPVTGFTDVLYLIYDVPSGGTALTPDVLAGVQPDDNGRFSMQLSADTSIFDGRDLWLELEVNGQVLSPRQPIRSAPYAAFAFNAPFMTNGTSVYYDGGNLGIGIADPATPLEVDGQIRSSGDGANVVVFNPDNQGASTIFGFKDNVARWRVGGNGPGANGGWDFQRVGDQSVMRILDNGNVGIGTTAPNAKLSILNNSGRPAVDVQQNSSVGTAASISNLSGSSNIALSVVHSGPGTALDAYNYGTGVAASIFADNSNSTATTLDVTNFGKGYAASVRQTSSNATLPAMLVTSDTNNTSLQTMKVTNLGNGHAGEFVADTPAFAGGFGDAVRGIAHGAGCGVYGVNDIGTGYGVYAQASSSNAIPLRANYTGAPGGDIAIFQSAGFNEARIDDNGRGYFNGGTQLSGADVAEAFEVEGDVSAYEPGDVLVISTEADRTVTRSAEPYSTLVAGIHATKPGVLLTERSIEESLDDTVPMGVVGVLPTKVTTENGPIRRGDLLVTSSLSGHAMKGTDRSRMIGSIIGKALENYDGDEPGVIRVMVSTR